MCPAVEENNPDIVQCLLDRKEIDVNIQSFYYQKQYTALHSAIELKNIKIIKLLLEKPLCIDSFQYLNG